MYRKQLISASSGKSLQDHISECLKVHRLLNGFSQDDVAKAISISRTKYNRIENGRMCPDIITLCDLLVFYDISLEQLLNMSISFDSASEQSSEEQVDKSDCSRHCCDGHDRA